MTTDRTDSTRAAAARGWRSEVDRLAGQLAAIDAWNNARRARDQAAASTALTREARLDLSRRMEARRREHEAVLQRAEQQMAQSEHLLREHQARAVLAHRSAWLRDKVADSLTERGVRVIGLHEDGAEAAGTIVVEQPDLVLVEDRLPTLPGVQVVERVRRFAPRTVVGAQVLDPSTTPALLQAGADAVFTRRVRPAEMAAELLRLLERGPAAPV
jgi:CheY-like chemotaxis protein